MSNIHDSCLWVIVGTKHQNENNPVKLGKGVHIAHLNVRGLMGGDIPMLQV